jgi:methyl-accepting chemotaxis protein
MTTRQTNRKYISVFILCAISIVVVTWTIEEKFIANGTISLFVDLLVAACIAWLFERYLESSINRSTDALIDKIRRVSHGDLTQRFKEDPDDALPYGLSFALGELMAFLRSQIGEVWKISSQLVRQLEQLSLFSRESLEKLVAEAENLAAIGRHIEDIRTGTGEMSKEIANLRVSASNDVGVLARIGKESATAVRDVKSQNATLKTLSDDLRKVHLCAHNLREMLDDFSGLSQKISEITKSLSDLSTESILVKLNVSIDAAQKQTTEENFRQLAEETKRLVESVTALAGSSDSTAGFAQTKIADLSRKIGQSEDIARSGIMRVEKTCGLLGEMEIRFSELVMLYGQVFDHVKELSGLTSKADSRTWEFSSMARKSSESFDKLKADSQLTQMRFSQLEEKMKTIQDSLKRLEEFRNAFQIA